MAKIKLSKKQKKVIMEMRSGATLVWWSGLNASVSLVNSDIKVSLATFFVLQQERIIEERPIQSLSTGTKYQLSELG